MDRVCLRHHRLQGVEGRQADKPSKRTDVILSMVCISFFLVVWPMDCFRGTRWATVHTYTPRQLGGKEGGRPRPGRVFFAGTHTPSVRSVVVLGMMPIWLRVFLLSFGHNSGRGDIARDGEALLHGCGESSNGSGTAVVASPRIRLELSSFRFSRPLCCVISLFRRRVCSRGQGARRGVFGAGGGVYS